jgi:hypothetical protein
MWNWWFNFLTHSRETEATKGREVAWGFAECVWSQVPSFTMLSTRRQGTKRPTPLPTKESHSPHTHMHVHRHTHRAAHNCFPPPELCISCTSPLHSPQPLQHPRTWLRISLTRGHSHPMLCYHALHLTNKDLRSAFVVCCPLLLLNKGAHLEMPRLWRDLAPPCCLLSLG